MKLYLLTYTECCRFYILGDDKQKDVRIVNREKFKMDREDRNNKNDATVRSNKEKEIGRSAAHRDFSSRPDRDRHYRDTSSAVAREKDYDDRNNRNHRDRFMKDAATSREMDNRLRLRRERDYEIYRNRRDRYRRSIAFP